MSRRWHNRAMTSEKKSPLILQARGESHVTHAWNRFLNPLFPVMGDPAPGSDITSRELLEKLTGITGVAFDPAHGNDTIAAVKYSYSNDGVLHLEEISAEEFYESPKGLRVSDDLAVTTIDGDFRRVP